MLQDSFTMRLNHTFIFLSFLLCSAHGAAAQDSIPDWSYDGAADGQEKWAFLSHEYAACELGKEQSPIVISYTKPSFKPPLDIRYKNASASVVFDGKILRAELKDPLILSAEAKEYTLKHIAFHSPSEHVIKQKFYPLEMQLVHEDSSGNKLILSVFADTGAANSAADPLLKAASGIIGNRGDAVFDASGLLPKERGFFAYRGSLTYPPCTEGVEWRIFKEAISFSKEQLTIIGDIVGRNARLMQPVYMRTVEETGQ